MPRKPTTAEMPPGLNASKKPNKAQLAALQEMTDQLSAQVGRIGMDDLQALAPILRRATNEIQADMKVWLGKGLSKEYQSKRFTMQQYRRALLTATKASEYLADMGTATGGMLADLEPQITTTASRHLQQELATYSDVFGGVPLTAMRVDAAAIMASGRSELVRQFRNSANRYASNMMRDIRSQISIGQVRGETFFQMSRRLQRLGGPTGLVALRGTIGDPGAVIEDISEGLFRRYWHWAERMTRTEVMNAYSAKKVDGVDAINDGLDDDEEEFGKIWDAAPESVKCCKICRGLHSQWREVGDTWHVKGRGWVKYPPAHPNCRCTVQAWRKSWGPLFIGPAPKEAVI